LPRQPARRRARSRRALATGGCDENGDHASAISRLESGKYSRPTLTTIENYALVVGCELTIAVRMPRGREDVYYDPE